MPATILRSEMENIFELLLTPLSYPFMVRGLLAAGMVGVVAALVGTYVVLRGMAFLGDALAHAILPGLAIGYITGGGDQGVLFWWSLFTAGATALAIGFISRVTRVREDTAIGILFAGMFALGIALISTIRSYAVDLAHFLFGDVLGVTNEHLLLTGITSGIVILLVVAFFKEFLVISFDPVLARTLRLRTQALDNLLLLLIALTIVVSLQTVGLALMVAMLVTPAATAYLLTRRLWKMMVIAVVIAAGSGVIGLYLSFYLSIASGAAIVLTTTAIFLLVSGLQTALRLRSRILPG
jgi:manganese/iron transport system permease protein